MIKLGSQGVILDQGNIETPNPMRNRIILCIFLAISAVMESTVEPTPAFNDPMLR